MTEIQALLTNWMNALAVFKGGLLVYSGCQKNVPIEGCFSATTPNTPSFFRNVIMTSGIKWISNEKEYYDGKEKKEE